MVQTRTFRIDALDLATGAPLKGGEADGIRSPPAAAGASGSAAGRGGRAQAPAPSGSPAGTGVHRGSEGGIGGSSKAAGGDSGEAEQQRFLVPVIDMANHSTLAAGVNAELRLGAGRSGGLRFALDASEPPTLGLPSR